jgi:hypothetical protein
LIYTQLSDIEHEQNGWLTYDRKVSKIPIAELRRIHAPLTRPPTELEAIPAIDTTWKISTKAPTQATEVRPRFDYEGGPWAQIDFDDDAWATARLDEVVLKDSAEERGEPQPIFLRQVFSLDRQIINPVFRIESSVTHNPTTRDRNLPEIELFLNGQFLRDIRLVGLTGRTCFAYVALRPDEEALVRDGDNLLAIRLPNGSEMNHLTVSLWSEAPTTPQTRDSSP